MNALQSMPEGVVVVLAAPLPHEVAKVIGPARGSVEPPVAKDLWLQWLSSLREMLHRCSNSFSW